MYETFQQYLDEKITLTPEESDWIASLSVRKQIRRHQYLLQEGDIWRFNAFVTKGCLRTYSVDEKGIEHIMGFAIENWWIGDRESLMSQKPSRFNIDAIEDSEAVLFTQDNFMLICKQIPAFNDMVNAILQRSFVAAQTRIHDSISLTAEDKYQNFLEKYAMLTNRIPQGMIASYLGITPETLSRVRKNKTRK